MSVAQEAIPSTNGRTSGVENGQSNGIASRYNLDVGKLHALPSEQQNLYLFTFTLDIEAYVNSLGHDRICAQQAPLNRELHQIIGLSSPAPTRVIRNSLGRCFARILDKGDRKSLYQSINQLLTIINAGKGEKELQTKHTAVHCLGEIYKAAGDSAFSLASLCCTSLIRLLKSTQNYVGLRAAIFAALGKVVGIIQGALDESVARDIWKQARTSASADKAALVQMNACKCLEHLVRATEYFDNTNDFESLKTTVWKACDSSIPAARHAAASCLASIMVKAYSETAFEKSSAKAKKPKKSSKTQSAAIDEGDGEVPRPESPLASKKNVSKLELGLPELLSQLSVQYVRSSTSNNTRAAIAHCYVTIFTTLESGVVESNYGQVADHLLIDLLSNQAIAHDRYRLLLTRKFVSKILADCIGSRVLGETGRLNAAKMLINGVLKNYPQVIKERAQPSKQTLIGALAALAPLIKSLGSAFGSLSDGCREALVQVLQHSSYTVQIYVSYCLRAFVMACPQQLLPCASICMNGLNRELGLLANGRQTYRRCIGNANGLSAVLSVSPLQPLYSSLEISSRVLSKATHLLKSSSQAELRISGTQVQVAWILIGGLMALGPNFIKIHISQLLLWWRNALPKPLTRENTAQRQAPEISYLTHVRECALGSILSFIEFNSKLVTTDVSTRIATMLQNTIEFLDSLPPAKSIDTTFRQSGTSLQIQDLTMMVRRRVLQCYTRLVNSIPHTGSETTTHSKLLTLAVTLFADSGNYTAGPLGSSIANAAGNFDSIWDIADNSGFGISGLVQGPFIKRLPGEHATLSQSHSFIRTGEYSIFDEAILTPICGAREHDSVYLYTRMQDNSEELPDPPATEVVNSAIALFATALPLQNPSIQEGVLEQLASCLSSGTLQRDPGRKAAVTANAAMALLGALKVAVGEMVAEAGDLRHPNVERCFQEILRVFVIDQDRYIRQVAYEAIGRLCNSSGNSFTSNEINALIDMIVSNRDPSARAGCAMALGSIHANVGGMAAGFHLKKIHGILMSLCSDPNPAVHFCAIDALSQVADSAGLAFSGYVSSTLGLLAQLWTCDTHNEESAHLGTSNCEMDLPTTMMIAHNVDALINILGPDLQDMSKARELMILLVQQFEVDDLPTVQAEGLRAWEHVHLYDPAHVDFSTYVHQLQKRLDSRHQMLREISADGLYNLTRRDAERVFQAADEGLEDQIWSALNDNPDEEGIRNIIQAWLGQSSLTQVTGWIMRCQHILTKTTSKQSQGPELDNAKPAAVSDFQDEEAAGFNISEGKDQNSTTTSEATQELLRWQVRSFAMQCLSDLIATIGRDMEMVPNSAAGHELQQKIADVVRMAFLASTAPVVELCIAGLKVIDQILTIFGTMPDPDFSEALLLEQYQAQISSALTPAFGADSSPNLASAAVDVCATFIATGLVTDVDRMGRILKLLVAALESFTNDTQETAVGDLRGLSSNAQTMVRMAVLSAWAELQVASTEQKYLVKVMEPHVTKLTPLWLSSLQEFARLRFEPDISNNTGPARTDESLDIVYAALNRQTLLKFYQDSWLKLVDAIASLIDQDRGFVFDALDGKSDGVNLNGVKAAESNINYRDEPVAFFFVLFGIVIEALVTRPGNDSPTAEAQTLEILSALKNILRPSVSGNAIFQDAVFSETIELFDRLALTEGLDVQMIIVDIARNLCLTHPSAAIDEEAGEDLSEGIEQLFELTRIIVLVLASVLPNLAEQIFPRPQLTTEAVSLIQVSLGALVDASDIFPAIIKTDLHASILHIFATILGTGVCQAAVVPQALPIFRRFVQTICPSTSEPSQAIIDQLRGCLLRFLSILTNAQRRETEVSLPCAKNTLLACTILLTTASRAFTPNDALLIRLLDEMLDCLQDLGLAKVAAGCLRSILHVSPKNLTDEAVAHYIFPRLVKFTVDTSEPDPENARSLTAHALTMFTKTLDSARAAAAFSIIVPMLLARAASSFSTPSTNNTRPAPKETATRLLELASVHPASFRQVVAGMSSQQKNFMEGVIKEGGDGGTKAGRGEGEEEVKAARIKLTMSFGGS